MKQRNQTIISPTGVVLDLADQGNRRHVDVRVNQAFTEREVTPLELEAACALALAEGFLEQVAGLEFNSMEDAQKWINSE